MTEAIELDVYVSRYCPRCDVTLETLSALTAVAERQLTFRKRDVIDHLDAAVAAGVRVTPAFVLNGRLIASGNLTQERLNDVLREEMTGDSEL